MKLDESKLATYLEQQIKGFKGPVKASKFSDGQSNPTFLLEASSGRYVLRRKPPGKLLGSAHAVDREFRVMAALRNTDVPVAQVYHLCEDDSVIGSMFYVMEFMEGRIFWDPTLPEVADNASRSAIHRETIRVLAALHQVDIDAVGLSDYGKGGNYFARQMHRWQQQYRASETERLEGMEALIEWLPANLPADDGRVSLVHGDYRLDNMIFHPSEPRVIAVVDWELSTLGHPFADIAYQCVQLRLPYDGILHGLGGIDRSALGIPNEQQFVADYCRHMGIERIDHWAFYLAFCLFRLIAIVQGVRKRALSGNASSDKGLAVGELVVPMSAMALEVIG